MIRKITPLLLCSILSASEYIIPPEFDNMIASTTSASEVLISNINGHWSKKNYKISKKTLRFRCETMPKIRCGNGYSPEIKVSLRQTPTLRERTKNELVNIFQTKVVWEDKDANNWNVCGGAVGGMVWDKVDLVSPSKNKIRIDYNPLSKEDISYFFTNITSTQRGSNKSYMIIHSEQMCR